MDTNETGLLKRLTTAFNALRWWRRISHLSVAIVL